MKRYIEKYFLFLLFFIFTLSLVNITSIFALGKTADILPSVKKFITKGVDTEACKRNASKTGLAQYSETCRKQCTSKDAKYTKFKADNKKACDFLAAAGGAGGTSGTGTPDASAQPAVGGTGGTGTPDASAQPAVGGTGGGTGTPDASAQPAVGGTGGGTGTGDVEAKKAQLKEEQAKQAQILLEEEIKNDDFDLSTKEAFDKIKKVFDVTAARIPFSKFFTQEYVFDIAIGLTGLVPVRVTITPKDGASETNNLALLEQLKKAFNQRIIDLANNNNKPINLGATEHTAPVEDSLYEFIYKGAILNLAVLPYNIITDPGESIKAVPTNEIVNAWVIAVRKPKPLESASAIDILLQLDGAPGYVSGFEKLSGLKVSHAHIADPAATGAAFVAQENFVAGLAPNTKAQDDCSLSDTLFVDILKAQPACRNLLKITVPTDTTAEFGIPDGAVLDPSATPADHVEAVDVHTNEDFQDTIARIAFSLNLIKAFTNYFNPILEESHDRYLYASDVIRNQLKTFKNVEDFSATHNWPASEHVQAALATLPAQHPDPAKAAEGGTTASLFRVAGDPKSVYFTKEIKRPPAPDPAPEASGGGAGGGGTSSADVKQP